MTAIHVHVDSFISRFMGCHGSTRWHVTCHTHDIQLFSPDRGKCGFSVSLSLQMMKHAHPLVYTYVAPRQEKQDKWCRDSHVYWPYPLSKHLTDDSCHHSSCENSHIPTNHTTSNCCCIFTALATATWTIIVLEYKTCIIILGCHYTQDVYSGTFCGGSIC